MKVCDYLSAFEEEYSILFDMGLFITGIYKDAEESDHKEDLRIGIAHSLEPYDEIIPEQCHMSVMHPFLFDNRKIPESFMGIKVLNVVQWDTIPEEIEDIVFDPAGFETNHTPEQYEKYVRDNLIEMRKALKQPDLSYEDALDAICFGDFTKYKSEYEERRLRRLLT